MENAIKDDEPFRPSTPTLTHSASSGGFTSTSQDTQDTQDTDHDLDADLDIAPIISDYHLDSPPYQPHHEDTCRFSSTLSLTEFGNGATRGDVYSEDEDRELSSPISEVMSVAPTTATVSAIVKDVVCQLLCFFLLILCFFNIWVVEIIWGNRTSFTNSPAHR